MRGSYPASAASENWLHDSLVDMIKVIHHKLDSGQKVPSWNVLIPATLNFTQSATLKRLTGLKARLQNYKLAVELLTPIQRASILKEMVTQNNISGLLAGTEHLPTLATSFPIIHSVVYELFVFSFEKLTDLGVRDRQYRLIFDSLDDKVCIFCGFERVMSPQESRQDLDHYFPKSRYPFAAANMRNLVPMCRCCNRDYKHDIDVIVDGGGQRRKAYDPYNAPVIDVCLKKSIPFAGTRQRLPAWWVDFSPSTVEAETWDQILCIRTRYSRDVLNTGFNRWIDSFMKQCKAKAFPVDLDNTGVLTALQDHHQYTLLDNSIGMDFLKPKVFAMLIDHFESGNERVIRFVRDIVVGVSIPT